ncbi:hypothetical protein Dimus_016579 [Dionaea muscipula]
MERWRGCPGGVLGRTSAGIRRLVSGYLIILSLQHPAVFCAVSALLVEHAPSSTTVTPSGPLRRLRLASSRRRCSRVNSSRSAEPMKICSAGGVRGVRSSHGWSVCGIVNDDAEIVYLRGGISRERLSIVVLSWTLDDVDCGVGSHPSSGPVLRSHEGCVLSETVRQSCVVVGE